MNAPDLCAALGANGPEPKAITVAICENPDLVGELVALFLTSDYRISQRASNVFMTLAAKRPELIAPHARKLWRGFERPDATVAVRRNVMRILQEIDVPDNIAGAVFTACLEVVGDPREAIATRAFAVTSAARIAAGNEDLSRELTLILENVCRNETSKAVKFRARKFLDRKKS